MAWTPDELTAVGDADELRIASLREDGSLRPFVTIWVVRADDGLFVRSAHGPENGWFRRALVRGEGRVEAGGVARDVRFEQVPVDDHGAVDEAFRTKYARYPQQYVAPVVSPASWTSTFRLVAND